MGIHETYLYRPSYGESGTVNYTAFDTGLVSAESVLESAASHVISAGTHEVYFLKATMITATNLTAINISAGSIDGLGTISPTTIYTTTLTATNIYCTTLTATNVSGMSYLYTATLTATNMSGVTAVDTVTLKATEITAINASGFSSIFTATLTATNISGVTSVSVVTLKAATITAVNVYTETLTATQINAITITAANASGFTNVHTVTLTATNISGITIDAVTVKATTVTATNITATNLYATNVSGFSVGGLSEPLTATNIYAETITATNVSGMTNLFTATLTATNIYAETITATNVSGMTNLFTATLTATNISGVTSVDATTLKTLSITATNASGFTNLFANTITATNIYANTITATNISGVTLVRTTTLTATDISGGTAIFTGLLSANKAVNVSGDVTIDGNMHIDGGTITVSPPIGSIGGFTTVLSSNKFDTTSALPPGATTFYWKADNICVSGNLGVGVPVPSVAFEVSGAHVVDKGLAYFNGTTHSFIGFNSPTGSINGIFFNDTNVAKWRLYKDASNKLHIYDDVNNVAMVTFLSGGYVGIGTTTPEVSLAVVNSGGSAYAQFRITNTAASSPTQGGVLAGYSDDGAAMAAGDRLGVLVFGGSDDATHTVVNASSVEAFADAAWEDGASYSSILVFKTCTTNAITRTEKMRIDNAGHVGIGLSAPDAQLHVHEQTDLGDNAGDSQIITEESAIASNTVRHFQHLVRDSNGADWTTTRWYDGLGVDASWVVPSNHRCSWVRDTYSGSQHWGDNGVYNMTLLTTGLGIGTTDPSRKLQLEDAGNAIMALVDTTAGADQKVWNIASDNSYFLLATTTDAHAGWSSKVVVDRNGYVGIGTTAPDCKLTINANTGVIPALVGTADSVLHLVQADSVINRLLMDGFSQAGQLTFRRANGTAASPTQVLANELLGSIGAFGFYDGTPDAYTTTSRSAIIFYTAENWTSTNQGTYISFLTTPVTTTSPAEKVRIDPAGNVGIGTAIFDSSAVTVLAIANGTAPAAHTDNQIYIYSKDSSDATATLGLELEQAVEAYAPTDVVAHKIAVLINGVEYHICLAH